MEKKATKKETKNLETVLKEDKENLEKQREQLIAQLNQVIGAVSYLEQKITALVNNNLDKEGNKNDKSK